MKSLLDIFTDASGKHLARRAVIELAMNNIIASVPRLPSPLDHYLDTMSDADLLQWATNEDGNFP